MDNAEEVFHFLEEFSKRKPKTIPQELNDYLAYVARTGDPVYQWSLVKCLFKEKLLTVITDFYETTPGIEIPPYPNVDPFNYDIMKNSLIERLDSFQSAPFTVQRICELLTYPRKQYNRIDKFMRAVEKNILVVSTREPGIQRHPEPENGEVLEPIVNGSDNNSEYNVDVEMEDMSWKDNNGQQNTEPQPSSSDAHISVDDLDPRLQTQETTTNEVTQEKLPTEGYSESPADVSVDAKSDEDVTIENSESTSSTDTATSISDNKESENSSQSSLDTDMKSEEESNNSSIAVPEIKVEDAEMTEHRLSLEKEPENVEEGQKSDTPEVNIQASSDESSSDSNCKDENEVKNIAEASTSSEESSSSSDNNESNSNSPKVEISVNTEDSIQEDKKEEDIPQESEIKEEGCDKSNEASKTSPIKIESDNYSISDVNSELPSSTVSINESKESKIEMEQGIESKEEEEKQEIEQGTDSTSA